MPQTTRQTLCSNMFIVGELKLVILTITAEEDNSPLVIVLFNPPL